MRCTSVFLSLIWICVTCLAAEPMVPLTPEEAAKKVDEKVLVRVEIKSTGGRGNRYLNSHEDFKHEKNFTIFIGKDDVEKFVKAGIEKPEEFYKGKTIDVTGTVTLNKDKKPQVVVTETEQIKVVDKEKKPSGTGQ